jgi:hypothetical protein
MSTTWKLIPDLLPNDGQQCYIRVIGFDYTPFIAVFNLSSQLFTSAQTKVNYPAYLIDSWKAV